MSDIDPRAVVAEGAAPEQAAPPVEPAIKEMMDAGVFFGRTKAKTHPRVKQYVIANRNRVDVINLEKTQKDLEEMAEFVKDKVSRGVRMILVGTQPQASGILRELGKEFNVPVVTARWLGGTLTNYKVISQRLEYFKKLKSDLAAKAFSSYTKKEQLDLQKDAEKMEEIFSGLENMTARPDLLMVVDPVFHKTAVAEARRLGMPIVSFANTDADPDWSDASVLGNTKARTSVTWFLEHLAVAIREGLQEFGAKKAVAAAAEEKKEENGKTAAKPAGNASAKPKAEKTAAAAEAGDATAPKEDSSKESE